jgi:ferredoxin-NADP reductase
VGVTTIDVRVAGVRELAADVRELTLVPLDGAPLPAFSAGSHVIVHLPDVTPRRNAYSLACAPWATDAYRIAVRRIDAGRGGSRYVHELVGEGDVLAIEPPRNLFAAPAPARRHLLVAGGIGITPFVSYAHELRRRGAPFELHHAFREADGGPLLDELEALAPGVVHGHRGRRLMAALDGVLRSQPLGTHLSVCGPGAMMDAVVAAARERGWPAARIHLERFASETGPMEPFEVVLGRDGRRLAVSADETLLEALERAGLDVPYQCRQGVCGECRTGVLDGVPDHRDVFLTAGEREACADVMPCVSRCAPGGALVLDL